MTKSINGSKKIILNYASVGREDYNTGQVRLHKSIIEHWDGDFWLHSKERDGTLPDSKLFKHEEHSDVPYMFKFTMIQLAREMGYEEIYWLDASLTLNKDITGLANPIMTFHNLGHDLNKYITDEAVANLNCNSYFSDIKQIWGGAIGFNFNFKVAENIFDDILKQIKLGSFNEGTSTRKEFVAHRHDQAVMSVIFHNHNVNILPYGKIVTNTHSVPPFEYGEDFYIIYK